MNDICIHMFSPTKNSKNAHFIELLFEFELNIQYQFSSQFSVTRTLSGSWGRGGSL